MTNYNQKRCDHCITFVKNDRFRCYTHAKHFVEAFIDVDLDFDNFDPDLKNELLHPYTQNDMKSFIEKAKEKNVDELLIQTAKKLQKMIEER